MVFRAALKNFGLSIVNDTLEAALNKHDARHNPNHLPGPNAAPEFRSLARHIPHSQGEADRLRGLVKRGLDAEVSGSRNRDGATRVLQRIGLSYVKKHPLRYHLGLQPQVQSQQQPQQQPQQPPVQEYHSYPAQQPAQPFSQYGYDHANQGMGNSWHLHPGGNYGTFNPQHQNPVYNPGAFNAWNPNPPAHQVMNYSQYQNPVNEQELINAHLHPYGNQGGFNSSHSSFASNQFSQSVPPQYVANEQAQQYGQPQHYAQSVHYGQKPPLQTGYPVDVKHAFDETGEVNFNKVGNSANQAHSDVLKEIIDSDFEEMDGRKTANLLARLAKTAKNVGKDSFAAICDSMAEAISDEPPQQNMNPKLKYSLTWGLHFGALDFEDQEVIAHLHEEIYNLHYQEDTPATSASSSTSSSASSSPLPSPSLTHVTPYQSSFQQSVRPDTPFHTASEGMGTPAASSALQETRLSRSASPHKFEKTDEISKGMLKNKQDQEEYDSLTSLLLGGIYDSYHVSLLQRRLDDISELAEHTGRMGVSRVAQEVAEALGEDDSSGDLRKNLKNLFETDKDVLAMSEPDKKIAARMVNIFERRF